MLREDIKVTTKISGCFQCHQEAKTSIIPSLNGLKLLSVGAALIHWSPPHQYKYVDTWRAMIEMCDAGLIRSIGMSNFLPEHLQRLADETAEMPAINQAELQTIQKEHGIQTQAWSPFGRTADMIEERVLAKVTENRRPDRSPSFVLGRCTMVQRHCRHCRIPSADERTCPSTSSSIPKI